MIGNVFSFSTGDLSTVDSVSDAIRIPLHRAPLHVNVQMSGASGRVRVEWSNDGQTWEPMTSVENTDAEITTGSGKAFLSVPFVRIYVLEAGADKVTISYNAPK
jgi:beta-xylosidase